MTDADYQPIPPPIPLAVWTAGPDGIAHARTHRLAWEALCGAPATPIRLSWPMVERCTTCDRIDRQRAY
jgi:hypothetical protein